MSEQRTRSVAAAAEREARADAAPKNLKKT
jgi:hypothetical protein